MAYDPESSLRYALEQSAKRREEKTKQEIELQNQNMIKSNGTYYTKKEPQYDHPNTMENGTATVLYIITMIIGSIFNDRWLIWGAITLIYLKFITRHIRKK